MMSGAEDTDKDKGSDDVWGGFKYTELNTLGVIRNVLLHPICSLRKGGNICQQTRFTPTHYAEDLLLARDAGLDAERRQ